MHGPCAHVLSPLSRRRDDLWFLTEDDATCAADFDPMRTGCDRWCVPVAGCEPGKRCVYHSCEKLRRDARKIGWHPLAFAALPGCDAPNATAPPPPPPLGREWHRPSEQQRRDDREKERARLSKYFSWMRQPGSSHQRSPTDAAARPHTHAAPTGKAAADKHSPRRGPPALSRQTRPSTVAKAEMGGAERTVRFEDLRSAGQWRSRRRR